MSVTPLFIRLYAICPLSGICGTTIAIYNSIMAITISTKKSKEEKRYTKIAFLRSQGICQFCLIIRGKMVKYNNQFENEHMFADKNSAKMLVACSACNQQKSSQNLLSFCFDNSDFVNALESLLTLEFTENEIEFAGLEISRQTSRNSAESGFPLSESEMKWLCDADTRLTELNDNTVIHAKNHWIEKLSKIYDLSNCLVYVKKD